jgi:hemerythrin superfamily protein
MEITELLKEDHREVESLIAELEDGGDNQTFGKLKNALTLHTEIEETIFYPAMEEFNESEDLVSDAYDEHDEVDGLLENMSGTDVQSEDFQELLAQLKQSIQHHVTEEENQLFPQAEELLGTETLEQMGSQMQQMKSESKTAASGA